MFFRRRTFRLNDELPYFSVMSGNTKIYYAEHTDYCDIDAVDWLNKTRRILSRYKGIELIERLCIEKYDGIEPSYVRLAWMDTRHLPNGVFEDWTRTRQK